MGSRLSIIAGLLAGLLVAGALLLGFVFIGPGPAHPCLGAAHGSRAVAAPVDRASAPAPSGRRRLAGRADSPAPSTAPASPVGSPAASDSAAAPGSGAPGSPGSSAGVVVTP